MRTNLEKWNYYLDIINKREQEFIKNNVEDIPKKIYEVYPSGGMKTLDVVDISYSNRLYSRSKPTREDMAKIKGYSENMPTLTIENVFIMWEYTCKEFRTSGGFKYMELNDLFFTNKEEADLKSDELMEAKNKEEELLKNGHIRCAYCSKVVPEEEAVSHQIIFQNSRFDPFSRSGHKRFVDKKTNKYCSGKCAGNDQMAHEG